MKHFRPKPAKAKFTPLFYYKITIKSLINILNIYDDKNTAIRIEHICAAYFHFIACHLNELKKQITLPR